MPSTVSRRIGAASGLAYVVLVFAGNAIATSGSTVDDSSSGREILADLRAHHGTAFGLGTALELLGFAALLAFVAYLAGVLRRAEGEEGWLATAALGAGLLTLAVKLSSAAPMLAAIWRIDELDPKTARTLVDMNGVAFLVSWATTGALVGFAGLSALSSGALSRRLALAGVALGALTTATTSLGQNGPGVLGFLLCAVWLAAVSVVLFRRAAVPAPATSRPLAARAA